MRRKEKFEGMGWFGRGTFYGLTLQLWWHHSTNLTLQINVSLEPHCNCHNHEVPHRNHGTLPGNHDATGNSPTGHNSAIIVHLHSSYCAIIVHLAKVHQQGAAHSPFVDDVCTSELCCNVPSPFLQNKQKGAYYMRTLYIVHNVHIVHIVHSIHIILQFNWIEHILVFVCN